MEKWQVVVWAIALILVPIAGLIIYLFWLIERSETMAMQGIIRPGSPAASDRRHRSGCRRSAVRRRLFPYASSRRLLLVNHCLQSVETFEENR
jgi:hypothetical protein